MTAINILLVDDSPAFLESAGRFLATDPTLHIVGQALSGQEAIELVHRLGPDLVLMDIRMPDMNGLEAARQIKALANAPRVVILTLYDNAEYRALAEAIGTDGFVAKSDFGHQLLPLIHQLFNRPSAPTAEERKPMKNVLVVDDSATMRRMVMASLRGLGSLRFTEAASGLEAIEQLALAPVDLMILDLNMPDMHGLEVLQFVHQHSAYRNLPVIILTTRGDEASRAAALAAGAAAYLTKPFQPATLASQARALLGLG